MEKAYLEEFWFETIAMFPTVAYILLLNQTIYLEKGTSTIFFSIYALSLMFLYIYFKKGFKIIKEFSRFFESRKEFILLHLFNLLLATIAVYSTTLHIYPWVYLFFKAQVAYLLIVMLIYSVPLYIYYSFRD